MKKLFGGLIFLAGTAAVAAGAYWLYLYFHRPEPRIAVLRVESEPPDAEIWIDGKQVGLTPAAIENNYPPREYEVLVRKKGLRPWKGVIFGGVSARVDARLGR